MIRAIFAWFLISLTWKIRPVYSLLANMCATRFAAGTSPLRTLLDGFLFVCIGLLLMLLPVVGLLLLPITSIVFVAGQRSDYRQVRELIKAGRVNWSTGTIKDNPPAQPVQKEAADGQ